MMTKTKSAAIAIPASEVPIRRVGMHYLLESLNPGHDVVVAAYALQSVLALSRAHGMAITREQGLEWLSATQDDYLGEAWLEWRVNQIFD